MLVLTRMLGEKINFYRDDERFASLIIQDTRLGGRQIRVGIEAPADVRVMRDEIDDGSPRRAPRDIHPFLPLALCGPGRSGKDEAALWFRHHCRLAYNRSTSAVICPHIAADLGISEAEAWARRHADRDLWHRKGIALRHADPAALVRDVLRDNDLVVGVRDGDEIRAAREEGLVKLLIWIDRDVPPDPTLQYGPEECDVRLDNRGDLAAFHRRLDRLARALGLLTSRNRPRQLQSA